MKQGFFSAGYWLAPYWQARAFGSAAHIATATGRDVRGGSPAGMWLDMAELPPLGAAEAITGAGTAAKTLADLAALLAGGLATLPVTLIQVSGSAAAAGDNAVVAAPAAGHHLTVSAFVIQNESAVATTMILRPGTSSTTAWRCLGQNQGDGLSVVFPAGLCWRLPTATALNLNLSGANSCGFNVRYWVEVD